MWCRMSAGRASEGAGCVTWWGFSPARDLLKTGECLEPAGSSTQVWVIESSMEVVARQLLLLYLALMPKESMGNNEKTEVFLEVFGNGEIRSQTEETLRHAASQLSLSVTETLETAAHPFKERDELARIFKLWIQPKSSSSSSQSAAPILMSKAWDYRVRQHLGTRYDSKKGCFDWDLKMKLHERGKGNKVAVRGYWGDIVSSPYLSFGIETDDKSMLKTQNGQHIKTAQDISFANVQDLFHSLSSRRGCPPTSSQSDADQPPPESERKSVTINDLMPLSGISVTFLPLDSLDKLPEKQKFSHFFDSIYFSVRYILDANKEQEAGFAEKMISMALDAEFELWRDGKSDDVHAVFIPKRN
ncbi:hypothetical protein F7725_014206 [Dissostichus mawsoni]|uniref:Dynein axonemal assembly factor 3 n=1 Tax=Dissostichus mawsoni TaxID=36200 RepID=A0A7J5YZM5_DISMA|nr:hypothetical protein F7725_014206 [Dissostichus mawsoni]